jgi:peptidoglycan/xylan/chitin deacetylase (PgdA/CDA1 family)
MQASLKARHNSANFVIKRLMFKCKLNKLGIFQNNFHILAYHMISDAPNGFFPEESMHNFAEQVEYLKNNYDVISLEEIVERISAGRSIRRCAAITFDDGFRDNYEKAFPVLKKCRIPATIFLTTGFIEKGAVPWFIELRHLFMCAAKSRFEINLGEQEVSFPLEGFLEKRAASDKLMRYLQACPNEERLSILRSLPFLLGVESPKELQSLMLTWDQIREMSQNGIHFGAHTITHPILSQVSLDVMRSEIKGSKTAIEEKVGRDVKAFAYPFGRKEHYPKSAPKVLKELGFTCAVTTELGANSASTPMYELNRSRPWELSFV